jgi:hypothetical protein
MGRRLPLRRLLFWNCLVSVTSPPGSWQNAKLFEDGLTIASFDQGESGEIYLLDIRGAIYRLVGR